MNEMKRGFSPFPMKTALATVVALAALAAFANDGTEKEPSSFAGELGKRLSFNAYADVESAYICRGYVWDTRPYSAQYAGVNVDLAPFGIVEPSVWTYSAMSPDGHSDAMRRYAYAEADYLLRWYYDIDIAEGWRLRNGLGRQWVTNPGFKGGLTVCDWQALQPKDSLGTGPSKDSSPSKDSRESRSSRESRRKMTYKEKTEFERLEKEIAALEAEQHQLEEALCSGTLSIDELTEKSKRLPLLKDELDEKSLRWLELSEIEG